MIPQALFIRAREAALRAAVAALAGPYYPSTDASLARQNACCGAQRDARFTPVSAPPRTGYFFSYKDCHSHIILCCCKLFINFQDS
jgi:hypothetical protein